MFCKNCGASLDGSLKFCTNCGAKTDETNETNETNEVNEVNSNRMHTDNPSGSTNINTSTSTNTNDYVGDFKKGFNNFISYIAAVLKKPTMAFENVNVYLTEKTALVYGIVLAIALGIIQCLLIKVVRSAIINAVSGFASQILFGLGSGMQNQLNMLEPQWFKFFIANVLFIIVFICMLSVLSLVVYKLIMKKNVEFIDFVKISLSSLVLLVVINFVNMIAAAISIKLMVVLSLIGGVLYLASIIINFVNYLKNESRVIYSLPVVICISLFVTYYIYFKIM